jgi:hypothetical protein
MRFKSGLGIFLVVLGFATLPFIRFGDEFLLISLFLLIFGTARIVRDLGVGARIRALLRSERRPVEGQGKARPRIDPLLPVRVLKLAEARGGLLTVSAVAMALNVGLDECQLALDELVRKGAALADVNMSTGVASYSFPEFLPPAIDSANPR